MVQPNGLCPWNKSLGATYLMYSQLLITMNPSRVYIRARVRPTWAYNILGLLGHYVNINPKSLLVFMEPFRTLVGIIDDYFGGYYTEEMIESQVKISP